MEGEDERGDRRDKKQQEVTMFKRVQGLIVGILIGIIMTGGLTFAKQGSEMIEAMYSDVKIYIDEKKIDPKDANGNTVEPFICDGTTYLPVRAVGEAFGKVVAWDGSTNSVYVGLSPDDSPKSTPSPNPTSTTTPRPATNQHENNK